MNPPDVVGSNKSVVFLFILIGIYYIVSMIAKLVITKGTKAGYEDTVQDNMTSFHLIIDSQRQNPLEGIRHQL